MLEEERQFYQENLDEWLTLYPGRFIVIKGRELLGVFDTINEALAAGGRQVGLKSFLVRRVERTPTEIHIPALTLGLLNAATTRPAGPPNRTDT